MAVIMALCINLMAQGMDFTTDKWEDILAKAKAENKIVFVDAYATWCGPCKWMDANVFVNEEVGAFYNANFINAKIDMEKGEGLEISETYNVRAYPTFLFVNGDGELVHRGVGGREPARFIALGEAASDPDMQLMSLQKQYDDGERSGEFMIRYANALQEGGLDAAEVADAYLSSLDSYEDEEIMTFIYEMTSEPTQKGFEIMADNLDDFYAMFGKEDVQKRMEYALKRAFFSEPAIIEAAYEEIFPEDAPRMMALYNMEVHMYSRDADAGDKFYDAAVNYFDNYETDNWSLLNSAAWFVYENIEGEEEIKKAIEWTDKSIDINSTYSNLDTMAALYYKLGKKRKAKKWAESAIHTAKLEREDASSTKQLLKKINAM